MVGEILGGVASLAGGMMANAASAKEAKKNRDWQERMSNTAHQREVTDLRAAGLNPILSASGGSGASTPSGSTAQQDDVITPAISSAMAVMKTMADATKTQAEALTEQSRRGLVETQTVQASSAAELDRNKSALTEAQLLAQNYANFETDIRQKHPQFAKIIRDNFQLDFALRKAAYAIQKNQITVSEAAATLAKLDVGINKSKFGEILRYLERGGDAAAPWIKAIKPW